MKISFCIPSLNRPEYLVQTLRSICVEEKYSSQFEVCIYNNFSELSYDNVRHEIKLLSNKYNIKYIEGEERLNIDQSMFEAIKPAIGEYLFFIGDDDYLSQDGLQNIFQLFENTKFDMAIFNAFRVSELNNSKTELIGFSNRTYTKLDKALPELKRFCTYGNLLIKSEFIIEKDFRLLFGTSHAYGCFWLAFFRDFEKGINPTIVVPKEPVVNLRIVPKNYNLFDVVFLHTILWFEVCYKSIGEKSKKIVKKEEKKFWKQQTFFFQLIRYEFAEFNLQNLKKYNQKIYQKNRTKILIVKLIVKILMPFKNFIRNVYSKMQ